MPDAAQKFQQLSLKGVGSHVTEKVQYKSRLWIV
jgi:hypothetical protein